jgi:ubiquinone/menaquinone biosynthesis C-methylase UbiE
MSISLTKFIKDLLREPESMPTPAAILYSAIVAKVLQKPQTKIADDVVAKVGNGNILDLGSGPGYLAMEIARKSPSLRVYGIDLSRKMVKIARRNARGVDNTQFVFGNASGLPFKDSSIDLVVSTAAFHHWKTPRLVFDECHRVLETGGEVWIYDGCPEVFHNKAVSVTGHPKAATCGQVKCRHW